MSSVDTDNYIDSFINFEKVPPPDRHIFHLDHTRRLLQELEDPHLRLKFIHVAGTKGKGSTAAMIAQILKSAGYRVGLYTSPHICHYRERVRILDTMSKVSNGEILEGVLSDDEWGAVCRDVVPQIEKVRHSKDIDRLTYFEVLTAIGFYIFAKRNVDWVVCETGMGGRLDATNVIQPKVCVITPISLEHVQFLGDTTVKIAKEKAAIIKPGTELAVISQQDDDVTDELTRHCREANVPYQLMRDQINSAEPLLDGLRLPGEHQKINARCALAVIRHLEKSGCAIADAAIRQGFQTVSWPLRFEVFPGRSPIILDGAHNDHSMRCLVDTFRMMFPGQKATVIMGLSRDKNKAAILKEAAPVIDRLIATRAGHPRSADWSDEDVNSVANFERRWITSNVGEAMNLARRETPEGQPILVCGSIFVAAEARKICTSIKG